jgi:hypothetical protein
VIAGRCPFFSHPIENKEGCRDVLESGRNAKLRLYLFFVLSGASALVHDGFVKPGTEGIRQFINLVVAVDLNGLLGGIEDHMALAAPMQVLIELGLKAFSYLAVQILGQLL